ncbi:hypothetical protein AB0J42_17040 [Nonomuraea sp. NPDC049649]|uniref:hypothetical protein n=1 Tax=Nonomuraea sp. NPDC049649 TaxID=3155776 RepID=UPI00341EEB39
MYAIGEGHGRFQATVGVTGGRSDSPVTFTVFADVDEDEWGDESEELGVAAAVPGRSATLDVPLDGATRIILRSNASLCVKGMAVWADPRVF